MTVVSLFEIILRPVHVTTQVGGQQRFRVPLETRGEVCLNLDIRQLGLGGASCGPKPMGKYIFPVQREEWTLKIEPVGGGR